MIFHAQKCYALGVIFFSKDVNDALFFAYRFTFQFSHFKIGYGDPLGSQAQYIIYILVTVTSSGILKAKQKLGRTFNSDKLGGIDFTKISKLTMCSA